MARFMTAQSSGTRESEFRDLDGTVLRILWDPELGVHALAFLTAPATAERLYATSYAARSERPIDYPADFPFLPNQAVTVVHSAEPLGTPTGSWMAGRNAAGLVGQVITESRMTGWQPRSTAHRPTAGPAEVQIVELWRATDRRFLMAISGADGSIVSLFDNPPTASPKGRGRGHK
jgi:hypothetical protein